MVDNLNIHSAASFYEVFDAERARELSRRIEFCYTPVHGSWLNMAEIEISVLVRQCLGGRRIPEAEICAGRREPGARSETGSERASIGASPQRMPERSCADSIHPLSVDRGLARSDHTALHPRETHRLPAGPGAKRDGEGDGQGGENEL